MAIRGNSSLVIEIEQKWMEQFFFDPVMAAYVLMGAKLDVFQQARLRFYWFCPEVIDSSGVGTGKTEVQFVYLMLRCMLMPGHLAAIYFPNFQTGKDTFWVKFADYEERSPVFAAQFRKGQKADEEKANQRNPGAWIRTFKNGSKLFMPAPDFKGDSKNQASRDFNTVVIDEYLRAADQGEGIDKQIVDRARRKSFNKLHPVWCNHVKFLGHAESPQHKEYQRLKAFKGAIRDGSSRHALITFSYRDWSEELARMYREDNLIASQKRKMTRDAFRRQYLGIWTIDGTNYSTRIPLRCAGGRGLFRRRGGGIRMKSSCWGRTLRSREASTRIGARGSSIASSKCPGGNKRRWRWRGCITMWRRCSRTNCGTGTRGRLRR